MDEEFAKQLRDIEGAVAELSRQWARLSLFLEQAIDEEGQSVGALLNAFRVHVEMARAMNHMLRNQHAISGEAEDGMAGAIGKALDELSTIWGIDLTEEGG